MTRETEWEPEATVNAVEPGTGMPRWVRYLLIVLAMMLVLLLAIQFVGGGHGPGRHRAEPAPRAAS